MGQFPGIKMAFFLLFGILLPPVALGQEVRDLAPVYRELGLEGLREKVEAGFVGDEIRIRTSFSYLLPHTLVVIRREMDGLWEGQVWLWSEGFEGAPSTQPWSRRPCSETEFATASLCMPHPSELIDWEYVGGQILDSLDILSLPDHSELPPSPISVIDGLYLFAEMASRGEYRSVGWIDHEVRGESEAKRAYSLHTLVNVLTGFPCFEAIPGPWADRIVQIFQAPPPVCGWDPSF